MRVNQKGYSILELLIAASLTAVVGLGAAFVVNRTQQVAVFSNLQNDIDRTHYLNLQIARNVANIQTLYRLSDPTTPNLNLMYCLQMDSQELPVGTNCNDGVINKSWTIPTETPPSGFPTLPALSTGLAQYIKSLITVTPNCNTTGCSSITIEVATTYAPPGQSNTLGYQKRESRAILPNFLFVPNAKIDYTKCQIAGEILIGIDYANQRAICQQITSPAIGSQTPGGLPMSIFDSGSGAFQTVANPSCADGFAAGGLFSGDSLCNTPGSIVTPPPATIPSSPPPTMVNPSSPCKWRQVGSSLVPHTNPGNVTTCNGSNNSMISLGAKCNCSSFGTYCVDPNPPMSTNDNYFDFYCDY
jgi:hypothetical protein